MTEFLSAVATRPELQSLRDLAGLLWYLVTGRL